MDASLRWHDGKMIPSKAPVVGQFRADVEAIASERFLPGKETPIALAVSGGPDSMAMLALASAAFPGAVIAATVDHGLRRDAAAEVAMVSEWCAAHAIAHAGLTIDVPPGATGNLQSWARQQRYLLLKRWAVENEAVALATAHHADDQAETFLMRAARGSGLSGLGSIRARLDEDVPMASQANSAEPPGGFSITVHYGHLATIRPLLGWRRGELRSLCQEYDIPFIDDPSNDDERFDRTRFRRWLADAPWLDPVQIGRAAAHIAEADRDLLDLSRWLWSQRVSNESPYEVEFDVADLPRGVRRWLARVAIETVRQTNGVSVPAWSYASNIEHLLDSLEAGTAGTQAGVMASANGTRWLFREAPPRRST